MICITVPAQVDKNALCVCLSKSLRGALFKKRRHRPVLVMVNSTDSVTDNDICYLNLDVPELLR